MNWSKIISEALTERNMTKTTLAEKAGYARPSSVTDALARKSGIRIDSFVRMLNALGSDVIVRDQYDQKKEWTVDGE